MSYPSNNAYKNLVSAQTNTNALAQLQAIFNHCQASLKRAIQAIEEKDYNIKDTELNKVAKALLTLRETAGLITSGDATKLFEEIYTDCYNNVIHGNLKDDTNVLSEIVKTMNEVNQFITETATRSVEQEQQQVVSSQVGDQSPLVGTDLSA